MIMKKEWIERKTPGFVSLGVNIGMGAVRMDAFSLVESAKSVAFLLCGIAC